MNNAFIEAERKQYSSKHIGGRRVEAGTSMQLKHFKVDKSTTAMNWKAKLKAEKVTIYVHRSDENT